MVEGGGIERNRTPQKGIPTEFNISPNEHSHLLLTSNYDAPSLPNVFSFENFTPKYLS